MTRIAARHAVAPLVAAVTSDGASVLVDLNARDVFESPAPADALASRAGWRDVVPDADADLARELVQAYSTRLSISEEPVTAAGERTYSPPKKVAADVPETEDDDDAALLAAGKPVPARVLARIVAADPGELYALGGARALEWAARSLGVDLDAADDYDDELALVAAARGEFDSHVLDAATVVAAAADPKGRALDLDDEAIDRLAATLAEALRPVITGSSSGVPLRTQAESAARRSVIRATQEAAREMATQLGGERRELEITEAARGAARAARQLLVEAVSRLDLDQNEPVTAAVNPEAHVDSIAHSVAQTAIETARYDVAKSLHANVTKYWLTRRDEDVRSAHFKVDGQVVAAGSPFVVAGTFLRFPGDPNGPAALTRHCRCRVLWREQPTGRFTFRVDEDAMTAAGEEEETAQEEIQTDILPGTVTYLALVDPDDPMAIAEVVAVVHDANGASGMVFGDKGWIPDPDVVQRVSTNRGSYLPLTEDGVRDVVKQITAVAASVIPRLGRASLLYGSRGEVVAIVAAGGADRNRGNAERLRRYWTMGRGAAKIRWNTPGDWTRCYQHLSKYMGVRAKGYCALRHREMTGRWPNAGGVRGSGDDSFIATLVAQGRAVELVDPALAEDAAPIALVPVPEDGIGFTIPAIAIEGIESGDGRTFGANSLTWRKLPIPLRWQMSDLPAHDGSVVVGRIDAMKRLKNGKIRARGVFDTSDTAREAVRLIRKRMFRGVSPDMDMFTANVRANSSDTKIASDKTSISEARISAATIVPIPAFEESEIVLDDNSALVAAAVPVVPPKQWFDDPKLGDPTPLTIEDDGRVFGHIASWKTNHIGLPFKMKPPKSASKYRFFETGLLKTDGGDVSVGQLTLAGGHAGLDASATDAKRHYDDTMSAFADVRVGEDKHGIWAAGSLRPGLTESQVRAARASSPSGDWRPIGGALELVAVCQVNVPGFPIARARVASGAPDELYALVAAGFVAATDDAEHAKDGMVALLPDKESAELLAAENGVDPAELHATVFYVDDVSGWDDDRKSGIVESIRAAANSLRPFAASVSGHGSLGDARGVYFIGDSSGLADAHEGVTAALSAYDDLTPQREPWIPHVTGTYDGEIGDLPVEKGTPVTFDRLAVVVGDEWMELPFGQDETLAQVASAARARVFKDYSPETREKLAKEGNALPDGSYPISDVQDLKNAIKAYGRSKESDRAKVRRHIMKRARALGHPELIPDEWAKSNAVRAQVASLRAQVYS